MWSIVNSMGHPAHTMGPFASQKRQFSLNVKEVPIVPGKTFSNPNFVIKEHPSVHHQKSSFIPLPFEKVGHSDSSGTNHSHHRNSALINSSQSLVDTLKEHNLDIVKNPEPESQENVKSQQQKMCSSTKKRCRRNQRNRRKRMSNKTSNKSEAKSYFNDMMDIETDIETICSDISQSPQIRSNIFNLTDFIVDKPRRLSKTVNDDKDDSDGEEFVATIISVTPSSICIKERQLSVSESEDSFIIFGNGIDEELESSEESESDSEEDWEEDDEEGEDVVDFVSPIVPIKKVRFAEDGLCQIHTMVKWSFAYQQARKGPWEVYARDRDRFNRRAADIEKILAPVFDATHRDNVYRERFKDKSFTV